MIKPVDVLRDLGGLGADGREDEEVLEVRVLRELRALKDDPLEEVDELSGELGGEERLDGG